MLVNIQHDTYWNSIGLLVGKAKVTYIRAAQLMEVKNEFVSLVERLSGFDHRTVQHFHDQIAAYFRYTLVDGKQVVLPLEGLSFEQRLENKWRTYWSNQVDHLCDSPRVVRLLLQAVVYQNTPEGYAAEAELLAYGKWQYFIERGEEYVYP